MKNSNEKKAKALIIAEKNNAQNLTARELEKGEKKTSYKLNAIMNINGEDYEFNQEQLEAVTIKQLQIITNNAKTSVYYNDLILDYQGVSLGFIIELSRRWNTKQTKDNFRGDAEFHKKFGKRNMIQKVSELYENQSFNLAEFFKARYKELIEQGVDSINAKNQAQNEALKKNQEIAELKLLASLEIPE